MSSDAIFPHLVNMSVYVDTFIAWDSVMALLALHWWDGCRCFVKAQNPDANKRIDHWYFGQRAGLNFSGGAPVADTSGPCTLWKGNTTMSDTAGNLLFYSDGRHVWNAQHDTMPNGDIWGHTTWVFPMDCAIAVPKPGDDNIYYIFTSDGYKLTQQNGLQYHIIDMSLDGGLGDVVQKNIPAVQPGDRAGWPPCATAITVTIGSSPRKDTENHLAFTSVGWVDHTPMWCRPKGKQSPFHLLFLEYTGAII